ncbi:MAG: hypothetical protein ACTHP8_21990 [Bosea sp. (in: a-proteobacteria)]
MDYIGLRRDHYRLPPNLFFSTMLNRGLEYQRALGNGLLATASGSWRRTKETGLASIDSVNLLLGLQKQIDLSRVAPAG